MTGSDERTARRRARIEERRRARRHQRRERWSPRPALAVAAVALVGGISFGVVGWMRGRDDEPPPRRLATLTREGSTVVTDAGPLEIVRTPTSYRVVYRLEEPDVRVAYSTDTVSVRRPFESRLETRSGRPPGGAVKTFQAARFAKRVSDTGGTEKLVTAVGPSVPASDIRLLPALPEALASGRLVRREVREVAGRRCQVYRSRSYLSAVELLAPTPEEHADTCVDGAGLVLEEVLFDGDTIVGRRVAVEVDEDAVLADDLFPDSPATVAPATGGGLVRKMKAGSAPPGEFLTLDAPPAGFEHLGRYTVIPSQPENFGGDLQREGFRQAGTSDVWVRGLDILVVDQGATLLGEAPFVIPPTSERVDLGDFGSGEARLSGLGNEVRALLPGGRYVRVAGTLPLDELAALARTLRSGPGGTLEYEEDQGV